MPTLAGVAVAAVALTMLIKAARGTQPVPRATTSEAERPGAPAPPGPDRRRFLAVSAGAAAAVPAGEDLQISGLSPFFTPNSGL